VRLRYFMLLCIVWYSLTIFIWPSFAYFLKLLSCIFAARSVRYNQPCMQVVTGSVDRSQHQGVASYGALGMCPPFDLQQFSALLTCTKSDSDYMSTVDSCKNSVTFACAPPGIKSWRRHWCPSQFESMPSIQCILDWLAYIALLWRRR